MKKIFLKHSVLIGIAVFSIVVATPIVVKAVETQDQETQTTVQERRVAVRVRLVEKKVANQTRLLDAKLKVCQNREKSIVNIMQRMSDRGTKRLNVFTKISDRVQAFYVEKGKVLGNYDALVSEINTTKAATETAVAKLKETSVTFKCDGTDPKGAVEIFRENHRSQITVLKAYRTAVKNLIVGVKSVQGITSSTENQDNQGVR